MSDRKSRLNKDIEKERAENEQIKAQLDRAIELLDDDQFVRWDANKEKWHCWHCDGIACEEGHKPDCELKKLLDECK